MISRAGPLIATAVKRIRPRRPTVSPEMTGYEDLDDNGNWSYAGNYGSVWYPPERAVGWAPYRFGHWVWVAPWGWTWVDDAPWDSLPFITAVGLQNWPALS